MSIKPVIRDIDIEKTFCLESTLNFSRYFFKKKTNKKFIVNDHHVQICDLLDKVIQGKVKKAIINIAPRYSKTELVVKNFIGYGMALNAKSKFIHLSYSDDLARDNSTEINNLVDSLEFRRLFEARVLNTSSKKWSLEQGGGMYAVSSAGQVTGFGAGVVPEEETEEQRLKREAEEAEAISEFMPAWDSEFAGAIIIDDPIKPDDARSETVREKVNFKFETTIRNRVNSRDTPIIIIMQPCIRG